MAEGCSPSHAADRNGPTAVFKSVSKLPTEEITGGVLLNQKVTPQMLQKEENREKLVLLLRTFFNRLHGYHVQFNVVSRDTLLDAQAHPENHRDLIVPGGWVQRLLQRPLAQDAGRHHRAHRAGPVTPIN